MIRIEQALDHAEGCAEPEVEYERFVRFDINCGGEHGTRGVLLRDMHQWSMVSVCVPSSYWDVFSHLFKRVCPSVCPSHMS